MFVPIRLGQHGGDLRAAHAFQRHCFQKLDGLASLAGGDEDLGQIAIERLVVGPGVDGLAIVRFGLGQIVLRKGCQAEVPPGNAQLGIERGRLLPRRHRLVHSAEIGQQAAELQARLGIVGVLSRCLAEDFEFLRPRREHAVLVRLGRLLQVLASSRLLAAL